MTYKVTVSSGNNYSSKLSPTNTIRANLSYNVGASSENNYPVKLSPTSAVRANFSYNIEILPVNLDDLNDVTITGNPDNYVLMYDSSIGQWVNKNPDEVLSAATTDPISPGLPADFENQLDIDLDNKIDLDAGTF